MQTRSSIFPSIFSLEIWWNIACHQGKPVPQFAVVLYVLIWYNLLFKDTKKVKTTNNFGFCTPH